LDAIPRGDSRRAHNLQGRERPNWQGGVIRWTLHDELRCETESLAKVQRSIKYGWNRVPPVLLDEIGVVTGFDCDDCPCRRKIGFISDGAYGAEICADADPEISLSHADFGPFESLCYDEEVAHIIHREAVLTRFDRSDIRGGQRIYISPLPTGGFYLRETGREPLPYQQTQRSDLAQMEDIPHFQNRLP
jgi:hypothetical protein